MTSQELMNAYPGGVGAREVEQWVNSPHAAEATFLDPVSGAEVEGLYQLAVSRADAVEALTEALKLLGRNRVVLSARDREQLDDLYERLAALD